MKRSHRIIFFCISVLALATFLFAILQFVSTGNNSSLRPSEPATNAVPGAR